MRLLCEGEVRTSFGVAQQVKGWCWQQGHNGVAIRTMFILKRRRRYALTKCGDRVPEKVLRGYGRGSAARLALSVSWKRADLLWPDHSKCVEPNAREVG